MMRCKTLDASYEQAVEYLTRNPGAIHHAWNNPTTARGGSLFLLATRDGEDETPLFGCLTQIRCGDHAASDDMPAGTTEAIRADRRIPKTLESIRAKHLEVFAEWQRKLDRWAEEASA